MSENLFLFLLDESAAKQAEIPRAATVATLGQDTPPKKSKADSVATLLNAQIKKFSQFVDAEFAVIGYHTDTEGNNDCGPRWGGALSGRDIVSGPELADNPFRIEQRTRNVPGSGGMPEEQAVDFPVWYQPAAGEKSPQVAAFNFCCEILRSWMDQGANGTVTLCHIFAGNSSDGNPQEAIQCLMQLEGFCKPPLVVQACLSSSAHAPEILYPTNPAYLPIGPTRDLFYRSSVIPATLAEKLSTPGVKLTEKSRGMLYNCKMISLSHLLNALSSHDSITSPNIPTTPGNSDVEVGKSQAPQHLPDSEEPESLTESITPLDPALIVFLLDRSISDLYSANPENAFSRLQRHLNDLMGTISKEGGGAIDTGIVSYGTDSSGNIEVRSTFEGPLKGRTFVRDQELEAGALRVEETEEQIPNGVGGLLTIPRKQIILSDLEPTAATSPKTAFSKISELTTNWCTDHPGSAMPPIILHLTSGALEEAELENAAIELNATGLAGKEPILYHLVITEQPHATLAYPETDNEIKEPVLQCFWRHSSLLLGRDQYSERATIGHDSRGFVVNGKFDLLLDPLLRVPTIH